MPPKRKSAASSSSISKKPKSSSVIVTLGKAALEAHGGGKILNDDQANELTAYIQHLKAQAEVYQNIENSLSRKGGDEPSETDIEAAAQSLREDVDKRIRKLMKVSDVHVQQGDLEVNEVIDSGNRRVKLARRRSPWRVSVIRQRSWPVSWGWMMLANSKLRGIPPLYHFLCVWVCVD